MEFLTPQTIALLVILLIMCILFLVIGLRVGARYGRRQEEAEWESHKLENIVKARLKQSRAVLGGLVSEQMAPLLPGFPFDPGDCRFVGKPIDFIVFKGMNEKDISEVIFLEVKSGAAKQLNDQEKRLKEAVQAGRVRWVEFDL
ncbi:Holliday junction resolvase [Spirochaetia bacterium]|nr:Holliday junction resolvase [Spirochaetia bacterium]